MKRISVVMVVTLIALAALATAQDAAKELVGKVYLKGGQTYEGAIDTAEFGVVEGAGIGPGRTLSNEYLSVEVNGQPAKVPVGDIATVEADWQLMGPEGAKKWQIASLTITKRDGAKVTGKVGWLLHITTVAIKQADGTMAYVHAFPSPSPEFDDSQLLTKIELGGAVAPAAPATPTETPAAPATPAETPAGPATPAETPAAPTTPAAAVTAGVSGSPALLQIVIVCPKCGEKITVEVPVIAKPGG